MRNKTKIKRRTENKLILIGIISLAVILMAIAGIAIVIAQSSSLEDELALLEQELEAEGYSWLINYSINSSIEVYEKDKDKVIAKFNNIFEDKEYKVFLDGSSGKGLGNKSQDIFDLLVKGNAGSSVEFDYVVDPNQSACGTLSTANDVYNLTANLTASGTCFTVSAPNITIDCKGFWISYGEGGASSVFAVTSTQPGTIVQGCYINETAIGAGTNRDAIRLANSNNSIIRNNTIFTYRTDSEGVHTANSLNITISNNIINSSVGSPILILTSNGTIVHNNSLVGLDGGSGIAIRTFSIGNSIIQNNITVYNGSGSGVFFSGVGGQGGAEYNNITLNNIYSLGSGRDIDIANSANNHNNIRIEDNIMNISGTAEAIRIADGFNFTLLRNNITTNEESLRLGGLSGAGTAGRNASYINVIGGNITTRAVDSIIIGGVYNSTFINMTIVNLGTAVGDNIIDFEALSDNNTFIGLDARRVGTVASHTVLIGSDSTGVNATFQDSILNHTTTGNTININANQFHMINFTNVSQANGTGITTSFTTGKNATISVNWWVDTFANYTNGSVAPNANITARDRNDDFRFELLTDANGRITKTYLTEYIINGTAGVTGVTTVYSNYTFNGTRSGGGQTINQSWNLTIARNLDLLFQFTPPATNVAPTNPSPKINATLGTNYTLQNLSCYDTIIDPDGGRLNVTLEWYNQSQLHLHVDFNNSYANNTLFVANLQDGNTTKGHNWSCAMRLYDGTTYSSWINTSVNITILNSLPTVSLTSPANGNLTINRTPVFSWSGSDDDGDTLQYELNLTCYFLPTGSCSSDTRYIPRTALNGTTSHTATPFLAFLLDNNYYYNWTARAWDGDSFGSWVSPPRNISIQSDVSISLPTREVLFGSLNISNKRNTTTDNPKPLVLRNDGNTLLNVSANFTSLFLRAVSPTDNYQFQVRNLTSNCFVLTGTQTTFTQSPVSLTRIIHQLNFTNGYQFSGCNNASIDVLVDVPPDEPAGNKTSLVTFVASLGEPGLGSV